MADSDIACNAELIVSGRDAPYDLISAEADDNLDYFSVGYARPRMPLGQTWGKFGAVAVATSSQNQTLADFTADMVAMANAYNPEDADPSEITPIDPPRDVTHMGNNDNIPIPDCQNCELRACPDNYVPPSQGGGGVSTGGGGAGDGGVPGVSVIYKNTLQVYTASCSGGQEGPSVTRSVAAGTYSSSVSQEAADALALQSARNQAESALNCCDPPTDVEDFVWTTILAAGALGTIAGGDGAFDITSPGASIVGMYNNVSFCNPWSLYDVTVTVDYSGTVNATGYVQIQISINGILSIETISTVGAYSESFSASRALISGNNTIVVNVLSENATAQGTIAVRPLTHP